MTSRVKIFRHFLRLSGCMCKFCWGISLSVISIRILWTLYPGWLGVAIAVGSRETLWNSTKRIKVFSSRSFLLYFLYITSLPWLLTKRGTRRRGKRCSVKLTLIAIRGRDLTKMKRVRGKSVLSTSLPRQLSSRYCQKETQALCQRRSCLLKWRFGWWISRCAGWLGFVRAL